VDNPVLLVAPLTLIASTAILSTALMNSDLHHRSETVIDPLTGMLNRKALATRVSELEQQSLVSGEPVGLVVGDLDHFKQVNDSCGHATGDSVLKEVAYEMRKELRAFDLAYRLGGEEFVILVLGAPAGASVELAERLRAAVAREQFSGIEVTISLGVAATRCGEAFAWDDVFARADAALYEAKARGRNRVVLGDSPAAERAAGVSRFPTKGALRDRRAARC
jgi:diguanylate cyclase (GGDEF)-like protein